MSENKTTILLVEDDPDAGELTRLRPVVILTSSREESGPIKSYSPGANSYIRRPVDFIRLIDAARQLWLHWLALNEAAPSLCRK